MDLIDREKLLEGVDGQLTALLSADAFVGAYGFLAARITNAPKVDAVPVTRCKDCIHAEYVIEDNCLPYYRCPYVSFDIHPDFYCANGRERPVHG